MEERSTFVGLDVHKETIAVAILLPGHEAPVEWEIANDATAVRRLAAQLRRRAPGKIHCCYEAGPCGFTPQRQLAAAGVDCTVIAPSLIPVKPGERIKTDRRDARKLAQLLRAGLLTSVRPPTPAEEAARDLGRTREDISADLKRARQRLGSFLIRRGVTWRHRGRVWGFRHRLWLRALVFAEPLDRQVFEHYLVAVEYFEAQLQSIDVQLTALAAAEPYREPVGWLRTFRGIDIVTALTLLTELHGFARFTTARELMAFLGLVPSEHSSGATQRRGALTKAGNTHVRRVLIEAAWHYRHRPTISAALRRRRVGQPPRVIALADKAQHRLHQRFARLSARGKPPTKVVAAIARELVGFVWAALAPHATAAA